MLSQGTLKQHATDFTDKVCGTVPIEQVVLTNNVHALREALEVFDIWGVFRDVGRELLFDSPIRGIVASVGEIAEQLCISTISTTHPEDVSDFAQALGETFNQASLRIALLQCIGGLRLQWTASLSEHLYLEVDFHGDLILYIFWFTWNTHSSLLHEQDWKEVEANLVETRQTLGSLFGYDLGDESKLLKLTKKLFPSQSRVALVKGVRTR